MKIFIGSTVGVLVAIAAVWYFFLKEYDYSINFIAPNPPGETHQILLNFEFENLENVENTDNIPFTYIHQKAFLKNKPLNLTWHFYERQDGQSRVSLGIKNENTPFLTRAKLLLGKNDQQDLITAEVRRLKDVLEKDLELYSVEVIGEALSPASTCVCLPLINNVRDKALDMMKNIKKLSNFIVHYDVEMTARPRIYVSNWDMVSNKIDYEFCFPINSSLLPQDSLGIFNIRQFPEKKSIMAIYKGNYMHSHLAWPGILDYAEKNNLVVEPTPLEIFYDNPEMGGDSKNWKAEIYFPIH